MQLVLGEHEDTIRENRFVIAGDLEIASGGQESPRIPGDNVIDSGAKHSPLGATWATSGGHLEYIR
jgi:hypothetical protein